jgi:hypothetical protein
MIVGLQPARCQTELLQPIPQLYSAAAIARLIPWQVETQDLDHASLLREMLNGRVSCVEFSGGNVYVDAPRRGRIYLPGSFNPLHDGHKELLQVPAGRRVCVERATLASAQ